MNRVALIGTLAVAVVAIVVGAVVLFGRGGTGETSHSAADKASPVLRAGEIPAPGQSFRDCADCPDMVVIPAGDFAMGTPSGEVDRFGFFDRREQPQHRVNVASFAAGKFHVTRDQYDACVDDRACVRPVGGGEGTEPVTAITWYNAKSYVQWLSRRAHKPYRLLTEAEWEYAARAGTTTPFYWGSVASHDHANYGSDDCCAGLAQGRDRWEDMSPVGSFDPNPFGLYDMAGNAYQWVEDCFQESYMGAPVDGSAWVTPDCSDRVARGGAFPDDPRSIRSARRWSEPPSSQYTLIGFRVARILN